MHQLISGIESTLTKRYSETFNFFQSKPIKMLVGSRKIDYVVLFRDMEILDDPTQYFKRYYTSSEITSRLRKLINYYEVNMSPPAPNLLILDPSPLLEARHRKHAKLVAMKEKSRQRRNNGKDSDSSEFQVILDQLNASDFSADSSLTESSEQTQSYQDEPLDLYQDLAKEYEKQREQYFDLLNTKDIQESNLIIDFKIIELLGSTSAFRQVQDKKGTVSIGVQTANPEIPNSSSKKGEKGSKQKEANMGQTKRGKSRNSFQKLELLYNSGNNMKQQKVQKQKNSENLELKKGKVKKDTFMDYYNAVTVKSSSNILEKYIKKKK